MYMYIEKMPALYKNGLNDARIRLYIGVGKYFFSISIIGQSFKSLKNSSRFGFIGTQFFIIMPSLFMTGIISEGDQMK